MVLDSIETFFPNSIGIGLLTGASNSKLTNKFGFYRGVSLNYSRLVGSNDKLPIGVYYYIFDYGVAGIPQITGFIYLKQ